ncbi:MAG: GFA family protein [Kiloniellales bacterium]|nr:GFA family protein [Kiloniellales bacterium]
MTEQHVEGGCLCGRVRYALTKPISSVVHCHCRMCRRASGALMVTWLTLPIGGFAITRGSLHDYDSSAHARRGLCGNCGTQISFWTRFSPDDIDITLGSLDHPEAFQASGNIWTSARIPWLTVDPDLPDHAESLT